MYRLSFAVLCLSLATTAVHGQDVPGGSGPASVENVRLALRAERLRLTDSWLLHEDRSERQRLRTGRWLAFTAHTLIGGCWGAVGVGGLMDEAPPALSVAAFSAAALTFAMAGATRAIDDDRDAARWSERAMLVQLVMMGTGLLVGQQADEELSSDGRLFFSTLATQLFIEAVLLSILHFSTPTLYISEHYSQYRAHAETERADYGLSLLLERERRQRVAAYTGMALGVLNATLYTTAAFAIENNEARPVLGIIAGSLLLQAAVSFIIQLATRTPSDNIALGLPPPADD